MIAFGSDARRGRLHQSLAPLGAQLIRAAAAIAAAASAARAAIHAKKTLVEWSKGKNRFDKWVHPSTLTTRAPDPGFVPTVLIVGVLLLIGFLGVNLHKIANRPPDPQIILPASKRIVECDGNHHPKTIMITNGESTIYYEPETNLWRHGNFKKEEADYFVRSKHGEVLTVNGAAVR